MSQKKEGMHHEERSKAPAPRRAWRAWRAWRAPPPPGRPPRYRGGCLGCLLPVLGLSFSLVLALVLLICLL